VFRIGSKGDYGLRALIDLAERYEEGLAVQARDIARRKAIPKDYLALIMVSLRKAGLVESARGPGGGYRLAHPPNRITMGWALRALEGAVELLPCTSEFGFNQCSLAFGCRMRAVWMEANRAVMAILDATTLADLCSPWPGATASLSKDHKPLSDQMPDGLIFHI
jgi:Rrf2 family protein